MTREHVHWLHTRSKILIRVQIIKQVDIFCMFITVQDQQKIRQVLIRGIHTMRNKEENRIN